VKNIGTLMEESGIEGWKWLGMTLGTCVYLFCLVLTGIHNYSLLNRTVDQQFNLPAIGGVLALELSALGIPILLHKGTEVGRQRTWTYLFYLLDFALIIGNTIIDASLHTGDQVYDWLVTYRIYVAPITPVLVMAGWGIFWTLSPEHEERDMRMKLLASTRKGLLNQIGKSAQSDRVANTVEEIGEEFTLRQIEDILSDLTHSHRRGRKRLPAASSTNGSNPTSPQP
jgi:hypothetical protein